ncbi:MAG TPA: DUF4105 domain-containing protein [Deltaproteobacteria bacterium]|nr:DUF4105 domain-containing protein [Deltaproteobacteria bacterium]
MHYEKNMFGVKSRIDDPKFFLAPDGKTNPASELDATIRAFFAPAEDASTSPVCRFAARYEWISQRLNLDPARLPVAGCTPFRDFMDRLKPESATLVFPMAHLNSPASMYGHTLIIVEAAKASKLLAHSISYSAVTGETFGPAFAVKSMIGLYPGYFSVLPYYAKLQEYSDVDHRDIWEYPLNLSEAEIRRMMLHVHELDSIASDYYFFDENCSFLLFTLLEAARPTVALTEKVHGWVIPLDSIRMIRDQGLVSDAVYRPSRTTKIRHLASCLPENGQDWALELATSDTGDSPSADRTLSLREQRMTLDLASEYLQYLYTKDEVPVETYQGRLLRILQARSRLGTSPEDEIPKIQPPVQPDRGHRSNRVAFGLGYAGDSWFSEFRIRPAYHHLMDSDDGYVEGAHLVFADVILRYHARDDKVMLEGLDLIDICSLSPRDRFFHPVSWKITTGFTRVERGGEERPMVYEVNPGVGLSMKTETLGLLYVMAEAGLLAGGVLEDNYSAGAGGSAGFVRSFHGFCKLHGSVRDLYYGLGDGFNAFEASLQQSFFLGPDRSVSLGIARRKTDSCYHTEATLMGNLFF